MLGIFTLDASSQAMFQVFDAIIALVDTFSFDVLHHLDALFLIEQSATSASSSTNFACLYQLSAKDIVNACSFDFQLSTKDIVNACILDVQLSVKDVEHASAFDFQLSTKDFVYACSYDL